MVRPRSDPHLSRMVRQSASAWHGMLFVGERVDDPQPRRGGGECLEPRLRVGADHRAVHPALEVARDVLDGLAPAERDVLRRLDHVAAELADRDLERRAGPAATASRTAARCAGLRAAGRAARPAARALFISDASCRQASSCDGVKSAIERNRVGVGTRSTLRWAAIFIDVLSDSRPLVRWSAGPRSDSESAGQLACVPVADLAPERPAD